MEEKFFISTASESAERGSLLPTEPSEDVSGLLRGVKDRTEAAGPAVEEYLPELAVEWVIDLRWAEGEARPVKELSDAFHTKEWEGLGPVTEFGLDAETGKWSFLIAADGPKEVTAVKLAWPYFARWQQDVPLAEVDLYEQRLEAAEKVAGDWSGGSAQALVEPRAASLRGRDLARLHASMPSETVLQLEAPLLRKFDGRTIWDVMLCLGLEWGDMDLFHLPNRTARGDDRIFSVWTSTEPGYFLPEEVAANRVKTKDLVFGFSIPRCAEPEAAFEAMWAAAGYARKRLGGKILGADGAPAELEALRAEVHAVAEELRKTGFEPGGAAAMRLF